MVTVALVIVGLTACGGPGMPERAEPGAAPAAAWSLESLETQPRVAELRASTPPDTGFSPASTAWTASRITVPDALRGSTPGELLTALASAQGWPGLLGDAIWEQTSRVLIHDDASATGVLMMWGIMDDAVEGRDVRVAMRQVDGAWRVERLDERQHCRRSITAAGQCG